jgi:prevent-host-death family protein
MTTLTKKSWPVAEAKARLSEVIERALTDGPQTITRHGRDTVVVVSKNEWDARTRRKGTLLEFLKVDPFR